MNRVISKHHRRIRRKRGIRATIMGTPARPRLTVFRSAKNIYAQVVNDLDGKTIISASTMEKGDRIVPGGNRTAATEVGKRLAERATAAGLKQVVFDRNGFKYHGRVQSLADAAREGGLKF
jgi:large subunit ribosomal protein L18